MTEDEVLLYLKKAHKEGKTSIKGDELPPEIVARLENDGIVTRKWLPVAKGEIPKNTGYVVHIQLSNCRRLVVTTNT